MSNVGSMLFIYTETSLHAGSGTALGAVDLPIQRERMSGLPMVQGSGIKGALREQLKEALERKDDREQKHLWLTLFGHEPPKPHEPPKLDAKAATEQEMFAGAVSLTDARLLLLPLRTVAGGWAWATCPMVLQRLWRDLDTIHAKDPDFGQNKPEWLTTPPGEGEAIVTTKSTVLAGDALLIEDFEMVARPDPTMDTLAAWLANHAFPESDAYVPFRDRLKGQLVVLGDTDFRFMTEHATEVVTRIRIGASGTVEKGALWSEEALPAETVLYSLALFSDGRRQKPKKANGKDGAGAAAEDEKRKDYKADELQDELAKAVKAATRIRLGGDRTTGRGLVALRATKGGA